MGGNAFYDGAPCDGNARSPSEDRRVAGTMTSVYWRPNAVSGDSESRTRA